MSFLDKTYYTFLGVLNIEADPWLPWLPEMMVAKCKYSFYS